MAAPADAPDFKADYTSASSLLCAVISLCATQLAHERARALPDSERRARLERNRTDAIRTLRGLEHANVDEVSDRFAAIYLGLLADEPVENLPERMRASTAIAS